MEEKREGMVDFLRELIRIDTQAPPGQNYDVICGVIADKPVGCGCDVAIHEAPERYLSSQVPDTWGWRPIQ